ncbi:MAG: hypothetical protein HYU36_03510 [Planctomycetes bacterium]|nr:hypothetical protein [Planctomycetota bacterium]
MLRPARTLLIAGLVVFVATSALTWTAWSGAGDSVAAARAALLEQARVECLSAGRRIVESLSAQAQRVFESLLTAGPEALPALWTRRRDFPDPVAELLLLDDRGRVLFPRPGSVSAPRWIEERPQDAEAREHLRAGYAAEFQQQRPDEAAAHYARCLDERFGITVRLEAISHLAALEMKRGEVAAAAGHLQDLLEKYPEKFCEGMTRAHARLQLARALHLCGRSPEAATRLVPFLRDLLEGKLDLDTSATRFLLEKAAAIAREIASAEPSGQVGRDLAEFETRIARYNEILEQTNQSRLAEWLPQAIGFAAAHPEESPVRFHFNPDGPELRLASSRAMGSQGRRFHVAFRWKPSRLEPLIDSGIRQTDQGPFTLALCDLSGRALVSPPSPDRAPAAILPVPEIPGWFVRADFTDPAALERSLQRQRAAVIAVAAIFLAVTLVALLALLRTVRREVELAALKTDFVSHVSHELKTPLSLIRLFAETLAMGRARSKEEEKECIDVITRESERLAGMINNILDFSRIEKGRRVYRFDRLELSPFLLELLEAQRPRLVQLGFNLSIDVPVLPVANVDREAMQSALLNLIDNAVKYSPGEKAITVRALVQGPNVEIAVADRGIGVPPHERGRIFEKFYRIRDERVRQSRGSGLGLTLVKHVMEAHGGIVRVDANEAAGSVFTLVLPFVQE